MEVRDGGVGTWNNVCGESMESKGCCKLEGIDKQMCSVRMEKWTSDSMQLKHINT